MYHGMAAFAHSKGKNRVNSNAKRYFSILTRARSRRREADRKLSIVRSHIADLMGDKRAIDKRMDASKHRGKAAKHVYGF